MEPKRYPFAALVEACCMSEAATARMVGLSGTTLGNARRYGLTETAADRYACRAGLVPWLVWTDWLDDCEIECVNPECDARFVPLRKTHRYCTRDCYQREYKREKYRRLYQSDPEFRDAQLAKSRRYREATRDAAKVKKAAYYQRNRDRILARKAERYRTDPVYRERVLAAQRKRDQAKAAA